MSDKFVEWDNSRRRRKFVTQSEYDWVQACEEAERKMIESEQELLKKGKKVPKRKDNYLPPSTNSKYGRSNRTTTGNGFFVDVVG